MSKLLPVPHFLVTLTVPEELRDALRSCPRNGYGAMFRAGAKALKACAQELLGGMPGWPAVLHTWTRQLGIHPHLHFIVAGCAVGKDGAIRQLKNPRYLFPSALLIARWREELAAFVDSSSIFVSRSGLLTLARAASRRRFTVVASIRDRRPGNPAPGSGRSDNHRLIAPRQSWAATAHGIMWCRFPARRCAGRWNCAASVAILLWKTRRRMY